MNITKILLCGILITAGTYIGYSFKNNYKTRVEILKNFIYQLEKTKVYLNYDRITTFEIISSLGENSNVFLCCDSIIKNGTSFPKAFLDAVDTTYKDSFLSKNDIVEMKKLSEILGSADTKSQTDAIDSVIIILNENLKLAVEEKDKLGKMYQSIFSLGSIAVAILIL